MEVIQYDNAAAFQRRTQAYLERNEAANNLILGITQRLVNQPARQETIPFAATVEEGDRVLLVVLQTPPKRLILYGDGEVSNSVLKELVAYLVQKKKRVPGVVGPEQIATAFSEAWVRETHSSSVIFMKQRVYVLYRVIFKSEVQGRFRQATTNDINIIKKWFMKFSEAVGEKIGLAEAINRALEKTKAGEVYLWDTGLPVSMSSKNRPSRHGIVISGVYTPPRQRGRGYATACVASLSQLMLDSGYKFCSLFADLANPTSNNIYQRIGYRPVADYTVYDFY
jgi:predicted GNAT family acetyltransferase